MKEMNKTLYAKLLITFLKASIFFGVIVGLFIGLLTNWVVGLIYGILAGSALWMGVPGILVALSRLKSRSTQ